jgi:hypothetical protein
MPICGGSPFGYDMIAVPLEKFCLRLHNETLCVARERAGYEARELGLGSEVADTVLYRRLVKHDTHW